MFDDILMEEQASGPVKDCKTRANKVWERDCYERELFTVGDRTLTKAEAFLAWAKDCGHDADECRTRWKRERPVENGDRRKLDPVWKEKRMRALLDDRDDPMRAQR